MSDFLAVITPLSLVLLAATGVQFLGRELRLSGGARGVLTLGFVSHLVTGRASELAALEPLGLVAVAAPWVCLAACRWPKWRALVLVALAGALLATGPSVDLPSHEFDLVGTGLLVATIGALLAHRAERRAPRGIQTELTLGLTFLLLCLWLRRGMVSGYSLAFLPGAWSAQWDPQATSPVLAWSSVTLVLLVASLLLSTERLPASTWSALALFLVCLGAPGAIDLWRAMPLVREVSPLALGPLIALGFGIGAARALGTTGSRERALAMILLVGLVPFLPKDPAPTAPGVAPPGDMRFDDGALAGQPGGERRLDAWIVGELPRGEAVYELQLAEGETRRIPAAVTIGESGDVSRVTAEEPLDLDALPYGECSLHLRFEERDRASLIAVFHSGAPRSVALIALMLTAAIAGVLLSTGRWTRFVLAGLVIEALLALWITNP